MGSRRWPVLPAVLVCLAALLATVTTGGRTATSSRVRAMPASERLDYSPDRGGRLRRLNANFVAEALGLPAAATSAAIEPTSRSAAPANIAAPTINRVSTPTFRCVNGHQTEDPLSPPCVAQFSGDNGGATARGVSKNEIRVLVRIHGQITSPADQPPQLLTPFDTLVDLDTPPSPRDNFRVTNLRLYQRYFNRHYQTFGRRVHFFVYFDTDQFDRGAVNWGAGEATDLLFRVQPFAAIELARADNGRFIDSLASHGVVGFLPGLDLAARQRRNAQRLWSYEPTIERLADLYATYVCAKAVTRPTSWSGEPGQNGRRRRFGIYHLDAGASAAYQRLYSLVRTAVRRCGGNIVAEATFPSTPGCGTAEVPGVGNPPVAGSPPQPYAVEAIRRFREAGVTTVLWPGCAEANIGPAALQLNYRPEWILAGDGTLDDAGYQTGDRASLLVFDHQAIVITPSTVQPELEHAQCYRAQRESDPSLPASYPPLATLRPLALPVLPTQAPFEQALAGCDQYAPLRQLFTAIQLAGPHVTADALATGLRSLDYLTSPDAQTPSCFYRVDNSCVQDAIAEYWDLGMTCWRVIDGGRRYLPGAWPRGNIDAQVRGNEPCNIGHASSV